MTQTMACPWAPTSVHALSMDRGIGAYRLCNCIKCHIRMKGAKKNILMGGLDGNCWKDNVARIFVAKSFLSLACISSISDVLPEQRVWQESCTQ